MIILRNPKVGVIFSIVLLNAVFLFSMKAQDLVQVETEGTAAYDALRKKYAEELYKAQKPIQDAFLKALQRLLDKFAASGDLEASLVVKKQIENFQKFAGEYKEMIDGIIKKGGGEDNLFPIFQKSPRLEKKQQAQSEEKGKASK